MARKSIKVTITSTFVVKAPSEDRLADLASEAGIEFDTATPEELDEAYDGWKTSLEEDYEDGASPPDDASVNSSVEFEEVDETYG